MFDLISPRYDLVNRLLSFGCDLSWRRKVGTYFPQKKGLSLVDLATGSGDQIFALPKTCSLGSIQGFDLSEKMLAVAVEKARKKNLSVHFQLGSGLAIPLEDEATDLVTLSFGIRNMTDRRKCLTEIYRILKEDGSAYILDFSVPKNPLLKRLYLFYLNTFVPLLGGFFTKDRQSYQYLARSIQEFPTPENFKEEILQSGFRNIQTIPVGFGAVTLYVLRKN